MVSNMSLKEPLANWNGEEMPLSEVRVPATDRAFLFGDGVYEAIRVYAGLPWLLEEHFIRFETSLRETQIACDLNRLKQRLLVTLEHASAESALIYIQVTRGAAERTHRFPAPLPAPNELIYVQAIPPDKYERVRECGVAAVTAEDIRWHRCDIKSLNLLPNCLAQEAAKRAGAEEAIFVDNNGYVTEGTHTNVFGLRNRVLYTAPLSHRILAGITRAWLVKETPRFGLEIRQEPISLVEMTRMSEIFLTGTTAEILGVRSVDGIQIGQGRAGEVTSELFRRYREHIGRQSKSLPANPHSPRM
jgi:D-alanine transaminase